MVVIVVVLTIIVIIVARRCVKDVVGRKRIARRDVRSGEGEEEGERAGCESMGRLRRLFFQKSSHSLSTDVHPQPSTYTNFLALCLYGRCPANDSRQCPELDLACTCVRVHAGAAALLAPCYRLYYSEWRGIFGLFA